MLITESAIREIIREEIMKNPNITLEELNENTFDNLLSKLGSTGRNLAIATTAYAAGLGGGLKKSEAQPFPDKIEKLQVKDSDSYVGDLFRTLNQYYEGLLRFQKQLGLDDANLSPEERESSAEDFDMMLKKLIRDIILLRQMANKAENEEDANKQHELLKKCGEFAGKLENYISSELGMKLVEYRNKLEAQRKENQDNADLEQAIKETQKLEQDTAGIKDVINQLKKDAF